jgi:hypothetical protein
MALQNWGRKCTNDANPTDDNAEQFAKLLVGDKMALLDL